MECLNGKLLAGTLCLALVLIAGHALGSAGYPKDLVEAKLTFHFNNIQEEARQERIVGGITMVGLGAAFGVAAIVASNSDDSDFHKSGPIVFGIGAGLFGALGVGTLLLPTDYEAVPKRFFEMPRGTPEALDRKIIFGEESLRHLSEKAETARLFGAIGMMALGGAEVVWYIADSSEKYRLFTGILLSGLGVMSLFLPRTSEREYDDYRRWRRQEAKTSFGWQVAPLKDGAFAMASWRF